MTMVSMTTEAIENQTLAARSIEIVGFTRWIASLVISVRMPSTGTIRMLTRKAAATAAKAAARPASGCRPTLMKAARRERDQDQVAGIGGDARQDADEHQHVGERVPPA